MTVITLLRYLLGDREAIRAIASSPHALWVGLLFVLSAGFAREYDKEDLLREPWYLFLPAGASFAASLVLFAGLTRLYPDGGFRRTFARGYPSFLGLFWMTAPLAWLYAIPYERFLSADAAVTANLLTLAVVAGWRVLLMIRVVQVCSPGPLLATVGLVLLVSSTLFGVAAVASDFALLDVMGGLHVDEKPSAREWLRGLVCLVPWVCLGSAVAVNVGASKAYHRPWGVLDPAHAPVPSLGLVGLAAFSVAVWAFVLPWTQPEQRRRRDVERAVVNGEYDHAVGLLAAHSRDAFPPGWRPPPVRLNRLRSREHSGQILVMLEAGLRRPAPEWVLELYVSRLRRILLDQAGRMTDEQLEAAAELLPRLPHGSALLEEVLQEKSDPDDNWSNRARLRRILDLRSGKPP